MSSSEYSRTHIRRGPPSMSESCIGMLPFPVFGSARDALLRSTVMKSCTDFMDSFRIIEASTRRHPALGCQGNLFSQLSQWWRSRSCSWSCSIKPNRLALKEVEIITGLPRGSNPTVRSKTGYVLTVVVRLCPTVWGAELEEAVTKGRDAFMRILPRKNLQRGHDCEWDESARTENILLSGRHVTADTVIETRAGYPSCW